MPKASETEFYAVYIGKQPGVYNSWKECEDQVKGFSKASYKKFCSASEADAFVKQGPRSLTTGGLISASAPEVVSTAASSSGTNLEQEQTTDIVNGTENEEGWDVVFTDGACSNNGKDGALAGIGVWWGEIDPRNMSERCPGAQTNNRAELIAIIRLLETHLITHKPLLIKTDSSYSISCIRDWLPKWEKQNWKTGKGTDVKNKELITYLSHLLNERALKGQPVKFQHVHGHQGVVGNEGADRLAVRGYSLPHFDRKFVTPDVTNEE